MFYGIIGGGSCGENIIEDGLNEIGIDGNVFLVNARRGASSNEDRVYDYLIENEADYHAYADFRGAPSAITDAAVVVHEDVDGPIDEILKDLRKNKGTLLLLWDTEDEEGSSDLAFKASDMGIMVKELTNGLAPITVADAPIVEEPELEEVEIEPFTEAELRSMSIGVLRKAATARGVEGVNAYEKEELVILLTDGVTHTEKIEEPAVVEPKVTKPVREQLSTEEGQCMIIVVMPNGTVVSTPSSIEEARAILGLS